MSFDATMREAARAASSAVTAAMKDYATGGIIDEPDITPYLKGRLDAELQGRHGDLVWKSTVVRHGSGRAAEENWTGADMIFHVSVDTPTVKYAKGVLIQAKRVSKNMLMSRDKYGELVDQCKKMLAISSDSFVFDYTKSTMRCGAANRIVGSTSRELYDLCGWTAYRFFLEFFRCPVGDHRLTSAKVSDLPAPTKVYITGRGELVAD